MILPPLVFPVQTYRIFLVKQVPGQGPEQRESKKTILYPQIIIILISYVIMHYYQIINYGEPSQPKPETELHISLVLLQTRFT